MTVKLLRFEPYSEDEGWHRCEEISVDQTQSSRELTLASSSIEQPKKRSECVVMKHLLICDQQ